MGVRGSSTGRDRVSRAMVTSITSEWNLREGHTVRTGQRVLPCQHSDLPQAHRDAPRRGGTDPLRTAVASATVAGMMKKELADTASWKRLM